VVGFGSQSTTENTPVLVAMNGAFHALAIIMAASEDVVNVAVHELGTA
jgi:hypothetical protein